MTETNSTPCKVKINPGAVLFSIALIGIAALLVAEIVFRYDTGELVLTARGCKILALHDAKVEPLNDEHLCRVRAEFVFSSSTERFGTVRADTPHGKIDIELRGSEVVSMARF